MQFSYVLGVDISKDWFHVCLMDKRFKIIMEREVVNRSDQIMEFISELLSQHGVDEIGSIFMCMEHTGLYINNLVRNWMIKGGQLAVIPATKISDRLAGRQGWAEKTDFIDARRIAEYGIRFSDKLERYALKNNTLELIQGLQRQRKRLLDVINLLEVPVAESKIFDNTNIAEQLEKNQKRSLKALNVDLEKIEEMMDKIIKKDPNLNRIYKLITSVPGVGPITAFEMIIATEGFIKFTPDQAKKFARYAGVVPLKHRSGKSTRKRSKTTKKANSRIKPLLTMGARSLIRGKNAIGEYYQRKIIEGKPHFSVINAIRNKLILRIFAVVRNDTMYVSDYQFVR